MATLPETQEGGENMTCTSAERGEKNRQPEVFFFQEKIIVLENWLGRLAGGAKIGWAFFLSSDVLFFLGWKEAVK